MLRQCALKRGPLTRVYAPLRWHLCRCDYTTRRRKCRLCRTARRHKSSVHLHTLALYHAHRYALVARQNANDNTLATHTVNHRPSPRATHKRHDSHHHGHDYAPDKFHQRYRFNTSKIIKFHSHYSCNSLNIFSLPPHKTHLLLPAHTLYPPLPTHSLAPATPPLRIHQRHRTTSPRIFRPANPMTIMRRHTPSQIRRPARIQRAVSAPHHICVAISRHTNNKNAATTT